MIPARDARQQDRLEVGAGRALLVERRQVREDPRVQDGQQVGQARVGDVGRELLVVGRRLGVPEVLLAHRDEDLVDQRVAQPGDLGVRAAVDVQGAVDVVDPGALAAGGRPDADRRLRVVHAGRLVAALGEVGDRHLDGDRVDVEVRRRVHPGAVGRELVQAEVVVVAGERAQVPEVEDRAEVDVEALGALSGVDPRAAGSEWTACVGQRRVVRGGQRADVARRAGQVRGQRLLAVPVRAT